MITNFTSKRTPWYNASANLDCYLVFTDLSWSETGEIADIMLLSYTNRDRPENLDNMTTMTHLMIIVNCLKLESLSYELERVLYRIVTVVCKKTIEFPAVS